MEYIFSYNTENKIFVDSIMDLSKILRDNRPSITDSSIKTYKSVLNNIWRKAYDKDEPMTLDKFNDSAKIIDSIKDDPVNTRKTKLAALVVLTGNKDYSNDLSNHIKIINDINLKQEKNEKQEENMISMEDVDKVYKNVESHAKLYLSKNTFSPSDFYEIQKWILLSLTSGLFIAPRRSADWNMKWKNYDEDKDNYVDVKNSQFVFNSYKTVKIYGKVKIDIPKSLKLILNKWFKINPSDYVLFDNKLKGLTSPQIAHRLNEIFNQKISTSILRHIYLTHKFGDVNLQDLNDTAAAMGTSKMEALQYVKH
jgi:hypothetical protein